MLVHVLHRISLVPVFITLAVVLLAATAQVRSQPFDPTVSAAADGPPQASFEIELDGHDREFVLAAIDECAVALGFRKARIDVDDGRPGTKVVYRWYVVDGGPLIMFTNLGTGGRHTIDASFSDRQGAPEDMKTAKMRADRFRQLISGKVRVSDMPDWRDLPVHIPGDSQKH